MAKPTPMIQSLHKIHIHFQLLSKKLLKMNLLFALANQVAAESVVNSDMNTFLNRVCKFPMRAGYSLQIWTTIHQKINVVNCNNTTCVIFAEVNQFGAAQSQINDTDIGQKTIINSQIVQMITVLSYRTYCNITKV